MGQIPVPLFYHKEDIKMPNTSVSLADAIANMAQKLTDLQTQVNNIENTRSVTTTTPPTADGTGLPAFVILDTKPEVEYKNYVYIYPKE